MPRLSWRFSLILLVLALVTPVSAQQAVCWQSDLETAKREALRTNRLVLVHYWATWCHACYKMEEEVFSRSEVAAAINQKFVPVKLNFDHYQADARAMGVTKLPIDIVMTPDGQIVEKLLGRVEPEEYLNRLAQVGGPQPAPQYAFDPAMAGQHVVGNQTAPASQPGLPMQTASVQTQPGQTPPPTDYLGKRYANYRSDNLGMTQPVQPSPQYSAQPPAAQSPVVQQPINQQSVTGGVAGGNQTLGPRYGQPQNQPSLQAAANPAPVGQALPGRYSSTPLQSSQNQPAPQQPQMPVASTVGPAVQQPAQPSTGPAPPKFGMDGFCPVSLVEEKAWKFGDRRWGARHLGVTYLFTSLENQQKFLRTPDRYSPVGLGNDIVVLLESGRTVPGQRKHGVSFAGRIYLFSSQESLDAFTKQPRVYIENYMKLMQANRPQFGQNVR
ncbi:MAG: thioredoxin family protein [Pirellulales bacterium]|nr:thioredoxin family protein [Pirellulales bacterium]